MSDKKQIHVKVEHELHQALTSICVESGQISILTRRLYRAFLKHAKAGSPTPIDDAGKEVAETWEKK